MRTVIDRRAALLGCAALAWLPALVAQAGTKAGAAADPVSIVAAIYRRSLKEDGGQFLWLAAADRPRTFSRSLVELWAKAEAHKPPDDDLGPIDFDPVTATNGMTLGSFKVRREKQDAATATVVAMLHYKDAAPRPADGDRVSYDFVREEGEWKVDDIRAASAHPPWSVRELLERYLKT
jgi:hypothetical protein